MTSGMPPAVSAQLQALLVDAATAPHVLEISTALARHLRRALDVVYVENAQALRAAALPFAQVLASSAARWAPLATPDLERAFRVQATRLREMTGRIALQASIQARLRVVRGVPAVVALELGTAGDLTLVGSGLASAVADPAPSPAISSRVVVAAVDDSPAGARTLAVAQDAAQALGCHLETVTLPPDSGWLTLEGQACRLLVLPRPRVDAARLAGLRHDTLLVG